MAPLQLESVGNVAKLVYDQIVIKLKVMAMSCNKYQFNVILPHKLNGKQENSLQN